VFPTQEEVNESFFRGTLPTDLETFNKWVEFIRYDKKTIQYVTETIKEEIETQEKNLKKKQDFLQAITK
jgi:hypothetical protein